MNQILVSQHMYVTKEMKKKKNLYKGLYSLCVIVVIITSVYFVYTEKQKYDQELVGQQILGQVKDVTTINTPVIVFNLDSVDNEEEIPINTNINENNAPSKISTINGREYATEAVLKYPRLGISYAVLSEENDDLLKISLCKYWGPKPNNVGNYCIVGHNYKSGKMFGKLSQAVVGDTFTLTGNNNVKITYSIYNKFIVEPEDVSCTTQLTNGKREVTLITCTNYGKQRLIVKAREI